MFHDKSLCSFTSLSVLIKYCIATFMFVYMFNLPPQSSIPQIALYIIFCLHVSFSFFFSLCVHFLYFILKNSPTPVPHSTPWFCVCLFSHLFSPSTPPHPFFCILSLPSSLSLSLFLSLSLLLSYNPLSLVIIISLFRGFLSFLVFPSTLNTQKIPPCAEHCTSP